MLLICPAPAAFRPLLTKGLLLSRAPLLIISISKNVDFGNRIIVLISIQGYRYHLPSEEEDHLFNGIGYQKGTLLSDSLFIPVKEA